MPGLELGIGHNRVGLLSAEERSLMKRLNNIGEAGHPCLRPQLYGKGAEEPKGVLREQRILWYMAWIEVRM